MYSPTGSHNRSPRSSGSYAHKKISFVYVCKLTRLKNGRYKVSSVYGADKKHRVFLDKLFNILVKEPYYLTHGTTRDYLNNIIYELTPNGSYRTYYNHIIRVAIRPKKLFI